MILENITINTESVLDEVHKELLLERKNKRENKD